MLFKMVSLHRSTWETWMMFLIVSLSFTDGSAFSQTNSAHRFSPPERVSHIMQMTLENRDGMNVGKLRNLAVDLQSGQAKYVILSTGGHFGMGAKLHAVPADLFSAATAKRDVLALNLATGTLDRAPVFKNGDLASLNAKQSELAKFYYPTETKIEVASLESSPRLTATGRSRAATNVQLQMASDLLGRTVVDRNHNKLGEVLDLLIGFEREAPSMALISTGKFFRSRGQDYAISLRALSVTPDGKVMIHADRTDLERAEAFNEKAWQATLETDHLPLYRYFAAQ